MGFTAQAQELLGDFLAEAGELLDDVDRGLVELERAPQDGELLNRIFRGFHTIKGGAGFLEAAALVELCHRTETLFDRLRGGKLALAAELMDTILAATGEVRRMFGEMSGGALPSAAPASLLEALTAAADGKAITKTEPDWEAFYRAIVPSAEPKKAAPRPAPAPAATPENTIRIDTGRYDQILNLTGEIGLAKNRIACLVKSGEAKALAQAVSGLDALVGELQGAVMKARMQPVVRVFQKYNRLARDLARQLGKEAELEIDAEGTEVDKTILDALNDPLVHLVRNAVDHGIETPAEREAAGKPRKATIRLSARQAGDRILIEVGDDGKGLDRSKILQKAKEKGLRADDSLSDAEVWALIFEPGFSTKDTVSDLSGRGVGMDVVRTNIERLKGRIDIRSEAGRGSRFVVSLPLTLAILPVLTIGVCGQRYAAPLASVREVLAADAACLQSVGGRDVMMVRGEPLPFVDLAAPLGRARSAPFSVAVIAQCGEEAIALGADACYGRDEVMLKPLAGFKPRGVAGATQSGDGSLVLVLELAELIH